MTAALDVAGVRVALRGTTVLDGLDLRLEPGECRALAGLNGAGKTTALRVVLGMLRPDAGTVRVLGRRVPDDGREVWRAVGHLVETPFSYPELTGRENVLASAALHGARAGEAARETDRLAEALGLGRWLDVPVRRMSLGTRQKVGLLAALAHRPRLAILDEPTNGLDPTAVVGLREVVRGLLDDGAAVLVTSHHLDELARLARAVDVLHGGRLVGVLDRQGPDLERSFFAMVLAADATTTAATRSAS